MQQRSSLDSLLDFAMKALGVYVLYIVLDERKKTGSIPRPKVIYERVLYGRRYGRDRDVKVTVDQKVTIPGPSSSS